VKPLHQRDPIVYAIKNFLDRSNFALFSAFDDVCNDGVWSVCHRLPRLPGSIR
jgi:hypothetical protein